MSAPDRHLTPPEEALAALRGAQPPPEVQRRIVEGALSRTTRRRVPWWGVAAGLTAAAAAAALLVFAGPSERSDVEGDTLKVGAHTVARGAEARLEVLRRRADDTLIRLSEGHARFDVEPLGEGEVFRVRTPEVEVEVVGTAFTVRSADGCSSVEVHEGKVRVSAGPASRLLVIGESMRHCASAIESAVPGEGQIREAQRLLLDPANAGAAAALLDAYLAQHADGLFVEEALFHLALARQTAGDQAAGLAAARRFIERFPESRRGSRLREVFPEL